MLAGSRTDQARLPGLVQVSPSNVRPTRAVARKAHQYEPFSCNLNFWGRSSSEGLVQ